MTFLAFVALLAALACLGLWRREAARRREALRTLEGKRAENDSLREQLTRTNSEANAQRETLFNSMVEGVLLLDETGRIQLVNRAFEHLFGVNHDVTGRTILEAVRLKELHELVSRVKALGQVLGHELDLPGLDRHCLQVNAAAILDAKGRGQGMMLVFHDLTRLKQLENTRQEFVANVSHELRTPLSMIKGYVETLIDGARDDPAVSLRFLQTIARHTDRLTYLIEDLLTISQLESGQVALNLHEVQLRPVAARVVEDLASRAAVGQVKLDNQIPVGLVAHADADRVQQVLFNLVDNAIKYGNAGAPVTIGGGPAPDQQVALWVHNEGAGIPPAAQERLFERFYRADKARSREQGGTGLGLAIVKHIVQTHGGEVQVESAPGQGATFRFTLPPA
jgi:two-component system phosphate regulon sensor histidine kinase PhoR